MAPRKKNKPTATEEQKRMMGALAGQNARQGILDACESEGLTINKIAKVVNQALEATQVRVQMDMKGKFQVSAPFVDHKTRLDAVDRAITLLDLKPVEKKQIDFARTLTDEEIDGQLSLILGRSKESE